MTTFASYDFASFAEVEEALSIVLIELRARYDFANISQCMASSEDPSTTAMGFKQP
jgi:hypothetical protein